MSRHTKDDRRKLDAILREINQFKKSAVKVGVLSNAPKHKVQKSSKGKRRRYKKGVTSEMAVIAATHEYGSRRKNIPERSWLRGWVDEDKSKINSKIHSALRRVEDGKSKAIPELKKLGVWATGKIKKKIRNGPFAPLKHREGTPLNDTAQFRNSINHEVVKR